MVISALLPIGETIKYITWDGMKYGKVVQAVTFNSRNFYLLDTKDYVVDTPIGFIRTSINKELLKAFENQKDHKID